MENVELLPQVLGNDAPLDCLVVIQKILGNRPHKLKPLRVGDCLLNVGQPIVGKGKGLAHRASTIVISRVLKKMPPAKKGVRMPLCDYGAACTRKGCVYRHPPKTAAPPEAEEVCKPFLAGTCQFGQRCRNFHPPPDEVGAWRRKYATTACRYGEDCRNQSCLFWHPWSALDTAASAEKRVDPSDGCSYTRQEFEEYYRGQSGVSWEAKWAAAKPIAGAPALHARTPQSGGVRVPSTTVGGNGRFTGGKLRARRGGGGRGPRRNWQPAATAAAAAAAGDRGNRSRGE
jgi:hypothetical protein